MKKIICASLLIFAFSPIDSSAKLQQLTNAFEKAGEVATNLSETGTKLVTAFNNSKGQLEGAKQALPVKLPSGVSDLQSKLEEQKAALAQVKAKQELEIKAIQEKIAQETATLEAEKKKQAISAQAEQVRNKFKLAQAKKALEQQKATANSLAGNITQNVSLKSVGSSLLPKK